MGLFFSNGVGQTTSCPYCPILSAMITTNLVTLTNGLHFEHAELGGHRIKAAKQSVEHVHDIFRLALLRQARVGHDVLRATKPWYELLRWSWLGHT
jgi:hypothetical protein